jgi:hypothetical protein
MRGKCQQRAWRPVHIARQVPPKAAGANPVKSSTHPPTTNQVNRLGGPGGTSARSHDFVKPLSQAPSHCSLQPCHAMLFIYKALPAGRVCQRAG